MARFLQSGRDKLVAFDSRAYISMGIPEAQKVTFCRSACLASQRIAGGSIAPVMIATASDMV